MVSEPILHLTQKQAWVVKPRVDQIQRLAVEAFQPRRHRLRGYLRRIAHWIQSGNSLVTRDVRYFIPLNFVCHLGTSSTKNIRMRCLPLSISWPPLESLES